MMAAVARGGHRLTDPHPWILDDPFALSLVGPAWQEILAKLSALFPEPVRRRATAGMVVRSRYAEDRLVQGQFSQYVILGAGLDSFAWRRPDVLGSLRLFEVDHPATQAWKHERAAALALPTSEHHVFAPIDFESETLRDGLDGAGFDWSQPSLFSWLGVTQYLTKTAVLGTLRTVASCAPGSEIVFSYVPTSAFLDQVGQEFIEKITRAAVEAGEPFQTFLSPTDAEVLVGQECGGLKVSDHPTRDELHNRYFTGRSDGLTPHTAECLIAAVVPGSPQAAT
jgi:methyltransferase (TIGR00027 family)